MNNPLAQKAQYYLNESNRLNEELQAEEAYSELLENVLFELLGEEDFTKLFEYVMKGNVTHDQKDNLLSKERSDRRAKRIGQIAQIGRDAAKNNDEDRTERAASSLVAKGANSDVPGASMNTRTSNVYTALKTGAKVKIKQGGGGEHERLEREEGDIKQKYLSKQRRGERIQDKNTF
jgi:hypothetical protein